ncbi:MAG: hypothetical protein JW917_00885, partial [Ignavibacteria bacterium]|nr:hypothetical protein [Ignavibacteria bacterium]
GDCDDKVLFNVIYFIKNKLPFKIVLSGNNKDYSHIYTEFFSGDKWLIFDNTYSNNEINKCYGDFKFLSKYDFSNYDFSD